MKFEPCYSLGGSSGQGWAAVSGTVNGQAGLPVNVGGADPNNRPVMEIFVTNGTATVVIEANGGALDSSFNPPSSQWQDISGGGYAMDSSNSTGKTAKRIPVDLPYVRCRITALAGAGAAVEARVPTIYYPGGRWSSPSHPSRASSGVI